MGLPFTACIAGMCIGQAWLGQRGTIGTYEELLIFCVCWDQEAAAEQPVRGDTCSAAAWRSFQGVRVARAAGGARRKLPGGCRGHVHAVHPAGARTCLSTIRLS